jgi:hypothetical protein
MIFIAIFSRNLYQYIRIYVQKHADSAYSYYSQQP